MHTIKKLVTVNVLLAFSIGGCASFGSGPAPDALRVQPSSGISMGGPAALLNYQLGRYHQSRLDYDRAIAAYREALNADPTHVEARNGLAIIAAMQGRYDEAARELRAAIALSPESAHLHNNLGYLHGMRGEYLEAVAEYSIATRLEPRNDKARTNLALARTRAAALAGSGAQPPAANKAAMATGGPAAAPQAMPAATRIQQVSNQIYAIQPAAPSRAPAPLEPAPTPGTASLPPVRTAASAFLPGFLAAVAPLPIAAAAATVFRLEVANGNGLNGFARAVSRQLAPWLNGKPARLTNQTPFEQVNTEIQYRKGHLESATAMASQLRPGIALTLSSRLAPGTDVRIVLGRDALTVAALMRTPGLPRLPVQTAQAAQTVALP